MATQAGSGRRLSVDEFVREYAGVEGRWELVEGIPVAMAGSGLRHARIVRNILVALDRRLRGTGCQPLSNDVLVETGSGTSRMPDVGIYCDPRDLDIADDEFSRARFPKVLFEVLSRSTRKIDLGEKLDEYRALDSVDAIVFVDPVRSTFETFERIAPNEWRVIAHLPGAPLRLASPSVEIPADEIFARD